MTAPPPPVDRPTTDEIDDAWADATMKPAEHRVAWSIGSDYLISEFTCAGDEASACHAYCEHCEISPCEHMPKMGKSCGLIAWFEDRGEAYYNGPETTIRDGLITEVWDRDYYLWHYADEPPAARGVSE